MKGERAAARSPVLFIAAFFATGLQKDKARTGPKAVRRGKPLVLVQVLCALGMPLFSGGRDNRVRNRGNARLRAVGADVFGGRSAAVDVGVAHLCGRTEFYGDLHADVLADGKYARAVFYTAAYSHAGGNGSVSAAFGKGRTRPCKGRNGNGNAYRGHLVSDGRAGLLFAEGLIDCHIFFLLFKSGSALPCASLYSV